MGVPCDKLASQSILCLGKISVIIEAGDWPWASCYHLASNLCPGNRLRRESPEIAQNISWGAKACGCTLNPKGICYRRNKSSRKRSYSQLCGVSWQCPEAQQFPFCGPTSYGEHPSPSLKPKGISCRRRNKLFWKRGYWQSCGVSFQSPVVTEPIWWGPKSYGPTWTQRASPAGEINPLEKGVTHSRVGYHCKTQTLNNLFLGVPHLMDVPWQPNRVN